MLYSEFIEKELECCDCPLYNDICPGGITSNGRGGLLEPPCCMFDDDTDMDEWVTEYYERQRRYEEAGGSV